MCSLQTLENLFLCQSLINAIISCGNTDIYCSLVAPCCTTQPIIQQVQPEEMLNNQSITLGYILITLHYLQTNLTHIPKTNHTISLNSLIVLTPSHRGLFQNSNNNASMKNTHIFKSHYSQTKHGQVSDVLVTELRPLTLGVPVVAIETYRHSTRTPLQESQHSEDSSCQRSLQGSNMTPCRPWSIDGFIRGYMSASDVPHWPLFSFLASFLTLTTSFRTWSFYIIQVRID